MLLSDIVHDAARKRPDHVALVINDERYTYAELSARVGRLAAAVSGLITPGDRVAILADNCIEYVDCLYGVPQAGAILTLLNQRLTAPEIEQIVADAEPRILFVGANHAERVADLPSRLGFLERVIVLGEAYDEIVAGDAALTHTPGDTDTAWLIYTSGTTGRPKGAMLSHRNIVSALLNAMLEWKPTREDRVLFCFPLCHVAAFIPLLYHLRETTVVMTPGFDPGLVLSLIQEHRITHAGLAPTMLNMVLQHPSASTTDTSSVTLIAYGGSSIPSALLQRGMERFGDVFCQGFGQTEVSGNVLVLGIEEHRRAVQGEPHLLTAAGRCECLAAVRVVDDDLRDVPDGVVGEIVIRGDQVMQGYWRNEEATRAAIADGWLRTGDLARRDDEGFFYIVDRKNDMVISGGENVYPREVENVIAGFEGVGEVAVIGLPDEMWGERVAAVVVVAPGAEVDPEALTAHCREHLAAFKVPKQIEFREELPKNAAMKVLKRVLREDR